MAVRASSLLAALLSCRGQSDLEPRANNLASKVNDSDASLAFGGMSEVPVTPAYAPATRRQDIVDVYHGTRVVDPYRWLEATSAERDSWFAAQDGYARRLLKSLPGRDDLRNELRAANRETTRVDVLKLVGDRPRAFTLRRDADDETPKLVVRDGWDGADRVLVDPSVGAAGAPHRTIDAAYPSPDGRYVAYVVSKSGSEDGTIEILDVESTTVLPDRIDRTQLPRIFWRPDGKSFFYWRRARPRPGATPSDWFKDSATYLHVIGDDPDLTQPVIRAGTPQLGIGSHDIADVVVTPGSRWALAMSTPGVGDSAFFVAPLARVKPGRTAWRRVATAKDRVPFMLVHRDRVYAVTYLHAPNYRVVSFDARSQTISDGTDFIATSELVLEDAAGAQDGMYVVALDRGTHRLFRVPWEGAGREEIALPFKGAVRRLVADPERAGVVFSMESWTLKPTWFQFDARRGVRELPMTGSVSHADDLVAEEATVAGRDGVEIPLSIVRRRDNVRGGEAPTFLAGYGAYGATTTPTYNPFTLTWVRRGGIYAVCHVRGDGARGKSWHLAGIKELKENGVDDFVSCAEYLIKKGYTSPARLAATGTSAGGIVVGGVVTKRPDLFRAAVLRVASVNPLREGATSGGPAHLEEYGDLTIESEFRSLLASDPYHRIRDGVDYPAVLLTVGLHDPRVPPWQPGKFAARLQATGRARAVLLRVEFDGGHGAGSTQTQREEEFADIYAFVLWQVGVSAFGRR